MGVCGAAKGGISLGVREEAPTGRSVPGEVREGRVKLAACVTRLEPTAWGCRKAAVARTGLVRGPGIPKCPLRGTEGKAGPLRR